MHTGRVHYHLTMVMLAYEFVAERRLRTGTDGIVWTLSKTWPVASFWRRRASD